MRKRTEAVVVVGCLALVCIFSWMGARWSAHTQAMLRDHVAIQTSPDFDLAPLGAVAAVFDPIQQRWRWAAAGEGLSDCSISFTDAETGRLVHITDGFAVEWIITKEGK